MTFNNKHGRNERGRTITYGVIDAITGKELFTYEGKSFNAKRAIKLCQERNISGPVIIKWERFNKWGLTFMQKWLKISKKEE